MASGITQFKSVSVGSGVFLNTALGVTGDVMFNGELSMLSHKITSLCSPTSNSDAATKGYVDACVGAGGGGGGCWCSGGGCWITTVGSCNICLPLICATTCLKSPTLCATTNVNTGTVNATIISASVVNVGASSTCPLYVNGNGVITGVVCMPGKLKIPVGVNCY